MKISFLPLLLLLVNFSCIDRVEPILSYEEVDRVVGPEGGIITFYESGLPGESASSFKNTEPVVILNLPQGALNSNTTFSVRKRVVPSVNEYFETWELTPGDTELNSAAKLTMTIGLTQEEYYNLPDRCFYKLYSIPLDANFSLALTDKAFWVEVSEYQLDEQNLTFSVDIDNLSTIYFYALAETGADYVFCDQSNNHLDLGLGGDHNVLVIPPGAISSGTMINIDRLDLPEIIDYPQPTIGDYVVLASSGGYANITANNEGLLKPALLFYQAEVEQAGDVWLDWDKVEDKVKILKVDPNSMTILEVLDYASQHSDLENRLYGLTISQLGAYVLAIPKSDFLLRFGGWIHVVASGGTDYNKIIEHDDFGGAFIDLFDARYDLNVNPGKDETAGYFRMVVSFGDDFENREFPQFTLDNLTFKYYDGADVERWMRFKSFGANLTYTLVDREEGWVEGYISGKSAQSAYNESGVDVQLTISFKFRIAKWYEI